MTINKLLWLYTCVVLPGLKFMYTTVMASLNKGIKTNSVCLQIFEMHVFKMHETWHEVPIPLSHVLKYVSVWHYLCEEYMVKVSIWHIYDKKNFSNYFNSQFQSHKISSEQNNVMWISVGCNKYIRLCYKLNPWVSSLFTSQQFIL